MKNIELVKKLCKECIEEGEALLKTKWRNDTIGDFYVMNPVTYVDLEGFRKWKSNCNVLINLLGDLSDVWNETFSAAKNNALANAVSMLGALKSINETIDKGYLIRLEDLIFAEAFSNLIE